MNYKRLTLKAHIKYLSYVIRHKWYVFIECYKQGIIWQGIIHDLSKFSKEEWTPYVYKFFGPYDVLPPDLEQCFNKAWEHHYTYNAHHWEHWVFNCIEIAIPPKYLKELIADWRGFGLMRGKDDSKEFYLSKKDTIRLHPTSRKWVEKQLGITDD